MPASGARRLSPGRWAFVVLSWNGREDTLRCLRALRRVEDDHAVYVADNGSHDGTEAAVRVNHPEAIVIQNGGNFGFSGGNNTAITRAIMDGFDWVVMVNNDAEPEPGSLRALKAVAERTPSVGVLAGVLLFDDGRLQWAGQSVGLRWGYSGRPDHYGELDRPGVPAGGPVDRAVGAFMAVSRAAIDVAGLLDDELFAYVEDVDWSLRIRAAGFACVLVPGARAVHALSASTGGDRGSTHTLYYGARNTLVVCERHCPRGRLGTVARRGVILVTFLMRAAAVQRSHASLNAVFSGVRDGRARRLGPRPT